MASKKAAHASRAVTALSIIRADNLRALGDLTNSQWPAPQYQREPVKFVRERLGEEPLPHQVDILNAIRNAKFDGTGIVKVAVRSGQKTGKTKLLAWIALWFYCSFHEAKVYMTASTGEQVGRVPYEELKKTVRVAKRTRGFEIEPPAANAATGIKSEDGRAIRGFTTRDIEAMAGLSGENMIFLVDEASALPKEMAEAIEGNTAGGGVVFYISNPTRTEGPFFDLFHDPKKKKFARSFHLDSEAVARYVDAHKLAVPGVATIARIDTWAEEYGRDSPFFIVRVQGNFLTSETGRIISLDSITRGQERWNDEGASGLLSIGIDPAGPGEEGDEFAFAIVRGDKQLASFTYRGLSEESAIEHLRNFLKTYRLPGETPNVILDSEGQIGSSLYGRLKGIAETLRRSHPEKGFEVFGVKSGHWARREPMIYERLRDELWANMSRWLRDGGAIVSDHKLETELHAPQWETVTSGNKGARLKATSKIKLREILGRSPDRADALCLAVWDPMGIPKEHTDADEGNDEEAWGLGAKPVAHDGSFDPYAALGVDGWGGDPYDAASRGRR